MTIKQQLKDLPSAVLIAIIDDLYGRYGDIDDIIDSHIEAFAEPVPVKPTKKGRKTDNKPTRALERQLDLIIEDDRFIDYRASHGYADRLHSLLLDIEALAEDNPAQALPLVEDMLNRHDAIVEGVDDSDGEVGDALRHAVDLWLDIAARLRSSGHDTRNWSETILGFYDKNDYGCLDDIISHSGNLLTEDELRQLAWRFENDAKKALNDKRITGYNRKAAHACIGIKSVAEALGDIELFEKGTLITSPQPNTMQIEQIVEFALHIDALERAAHWLQQPQWKQDKSRHARLNNLLLQKQGNIKQLKQNLLQAFQDTPNEYTLMAYWEFANTKEKQATSKQVLQLADSMKDRVAAIQLLLMTGATEKAAQQLIQHHANLGKVFYGTLLDWIKPFNTLKSPLATILCYRLLLADLLDSGRSKAYHHGADYFHALLKLDKKKPDYQGLDDAQTFIRQLQQKHWRKQSFWIQADYPNKST